MTEKPASHDRTIFRSVFIAYVIILLHVFLLGGVGLLIFFFRGIIQYWQWIIMGLFFVFMLSVFLFYRFLRLNKQSFQDILSLPAFQGRSVEVSLLGGLASVKMSKPTYDEPRQIESPAIQKQLLSPEVMQVEELTKLGQMLEKDQITREEYDIAKQKLFNSNG